MTRQRATVPSVTRDLLETLAAVRRGRPQGCLSLPGGSTRTPGTARAMVREWLRAWEIPPEQAEDTVVIVTELTANAVQHTKSAQVIVAVQLTGRRELRRLTVRVSDQGPHSGPIRAGRRADPDERDLSCLADCGRGLAMVDALADRWGAVHGHTGTHVWAVLLIPAAGSPSAHAQSAGTTTEGAR